MRGMKDSRIEWLGEIPNNWDTKKVKFSTKIRTESGMYTQDDVYIGLENVESSTGHLVETESVYDEGIYDLFRLDDVLFSKLRPYLAKAFYAEFDGFCTGEFVVFKEFEGIKRFLLYFLLSPGFIEAVNASTYGAKMPRASWDFIKNLRMVLPPISEQQAIADYLDRKCAEIDALTADIQTQIDTLEQYKRSVITEAVTKGLNPDAEMKESGIPWCPSVPAHWMPTNPKALFKLRNQKAIAGERQLTASQRHGIVYQDEFMEMGSQKVVTVEKGFSILKHVEPNDFVISMRSFQGGLEYSEVSGSISSAYVMLIPDADKVYPPFYKWFFKSDKYINALQSTTNLVRDGQAMRYSNFVQVPLFIIPVEEQSEIADYLSKRCTAIDSIIAERQQQLEIIYEYKKSLIYEYVTGKKEVTV